MSKAYELRCMVEEVGEEQQVSQNFKKREVIAKLEGEYPEYYKFEFVQDKTALCDDIIPGMYMTFSFNIKGRKVEKENEDPKYFMSLQAWKVEA